MNYNNHDANHPKGMNVCDGTGAVQWVPKNNLYHKWLTVYRDVPYGYWIQTCGAGNLGYTPLNGVYCYDPDGNIRQGTQYDSIFY